MEKEPLIVLVSGAPGSGKTTLASKLAHRMRLLHIPRDEFLGGMTYTAEGEIDRRQVGVPKYYEAVGYLANSGVSLVTDGTLYKGISEADIRSRILPLGRVVNIHCRATNEYDRFYAREVERYGEPTPHVEALMQRLPGIYESAVNPLDLGCERIEVDTTADYKPTITELAEYMGDRNARLVLGG